MDIHIVAIGRARSGPETALFEHFAQRVTRWPITLAAHDLRGGRGGTPDTVREAEGALLRQAIPSGAYVVALDERGKQLSSRAFAQLLVRQQEDGTRNLAFVIGGADGLAPAVRGAADLVLSLGRVTWPHILVRALLAEQIYRGQQIAMGHPYHRD